MKSSRLSGWRQQSLRAPCAACTRRGPAREPPGAAPRVGLGDGVASAACARLADTSGDVSVQGWRREALAPATDPVWRETGPPSRGGRPRQGALARQWRPAELTSPAVGRVWAAALGFLGPRGAAGGGRQSL